ncbi:protein CyaE [Dissulfurispira thermophila]|uniref:Protein CyaE n=1 Tax=Dissulfurispira thermophila TaxID=2715679 RepID=A0A7G1H3M8_9BACT|nr:TolC family protein [Dissulfurispira thermophila]BCB96742.1 protein CyaE [Dissulfurispira thermophila]
MKRIFIMLFAFTMVFTHFEKSFANSAIEEGSQKGHETFGRINRITISEGLKIAIENNRLIKIASHERDIFLEDTAVARSKLLPSINANISQTFLSRQPGAHMGAQQIYTSQRDYLSYGINAYQSIFAFGENTSRYEASKSFLEAKKLNINLVKNIVALDFINAYLDTLESEKLIAVAQKEVERLESHLNVARNMFSEGVITKNDLLQAQVRLSDARQHLLTLKNMRAVNASRINNILSRPLNSEIILEDVQIKSDSEAMSIEKAWTIAEKQRIEISIIEQELRAVDLEEGVKKSDYFPKFFVQGGYNYTENRYQLHEDNWSLILGANLNIFNGGNTKAEVSKVRFKRQKVLEQKNKLIDDIKLEVEKNYRDMKNADEKIRITKDAVEQAEENLRINKVRYEEGVGTATDVLDAITLLTTAETNYYRALYEFKKAEAGFMYAIGQDLASVYTERQR